MKVINNFEDKITENDLHGRSFCNKRDLIYLIRKFLLNNDGSVPKACELDNCTVYGLQSIWNRCKPRKFGLTVGKL